MAKPTEVWLNWQSEIEWLTSVIWRDAKQNHKCSHKRESEEDLTQTEEAMCPGGREKSDVTANQGMRQSLETWGGVALQHLLLLAQWYWFQAFSFQNWEKIDFCGLKPPTFENLLQ